MVSTVRRLIDDGRFNVNCSEIVELPRKLPLQIGAVAERENEQKERVLDTALHERTRVHLIATHALPLFGVGAFG